MWRRAVGEEQPTQMLLPVLPLLYGRSDHVQKAEVELFDKSRRLMVVGFRDLNVEVKYDFDLPR